MLPPMSPFNQPISQHTTMQLYSNGTLELFDQKANLWRRENTVLTRRLRVCVSNLDNENVRLLLGALRIIVADEDDYFPLISNHKLTDSSNFSIMSPTGRGSSTYKSIHNASIPITMRNEMLMLKALKYVCQYMLSKYPTTIEQDKILLHEDNLEKLPYYTNKRHAIIHIKGEKEVLHFYLHFSNCGLKLLNIGEHEQSEYDTLLGEIKKKEHPMIVHYCNQYISILRSHEYITNKQLVEHLDLTQPIVV